MGLDPVFFETVNTKVRALPQAADPAFKAMKQASARFYLDQIVPEAAGLEASASASAEVLYSAGEDAFAA